MKRCYILSPLVLAVLLLAAPMAAAQSPDNPTFVDRVEVTDEALTFYTAGNYTAVTMSVAGPQGFYLREVFESAEAVRLSLDMLDSPTKAGPFKIEMTAHPNLSDATREALYKARAADDRAAMQKVMHEAGLLERSMKHTLTFSVADGQIIDPFENEVQKVQTSAVPAPQAAPAPDASLRQAALVDEFAQGLPPFIAAAPDAPWVPASFQGRADSGLRFQGYIRPIDEAMTGRKGVFEAYFQRSAADGTPQGPWVQKHLQMAENGFRVVSLGGETTPATPGLFDYMNVGEEAPAMRDQVILDDLIVDGSICAGLDCVNGESFGFDTLRLKENNLRIKAQDTSTSASFPTQDWQLTFNDSSNGGANRFSVECVSPGSSIPFTVEGCAPSHSLYVDDGGRIGFGTNTPVTELHVKDGDTPTLRLEQDGSSGFTAQTWDLAGNETNFFIRDATNGSKLPFRIRPDAPSNSIYVHTDGNVGLGTSSPDSQLDLEAPNPEIRLTATTSGQTWEIRVNNSGRLNYQDVSTGNTPFVVAPTAVTNLMRLGISATNTVEIDGDLVITGQCSEADGGCAPDYVFEDDYERMTLAELDAFVRANKHLPGVPKGSELESEGINVREMNYALLEKIEELVLYTIEQQKTIDALRATNGQHEAALRALEARLDALER